MMHRIIGLTDEHIGVRGRGMLSGSGSGSGLARTRPSGLRASAEVATKPS